MSTLPKPPNVWLRSEDRDVASWTSLVASRFPRTRVITLDPSSVSADSESAQTFTVSGLRTSDILVVNKPSHTSGLSVMQCFASDNDELTLVFRNFTGSPIDPPSEDYQIAIVR